MRTWRAALAAMTVAGVVAAPGAGAASKAVSCNLLRDPAGDTHATVPGEDDSQLDLVGGDVATTKTQLKALIRMRALAANDATSPNGRIYELEFRANGYTFDIRASFLVGGIDYEAYVADPTVQKAEGTRYLTDLGALNGTVNTKRGQIAFAAPLSLFAPYASFNQTTIDHIGAVTYLARGIGRSQTANVVKLGPTWGAGYAVDEATTTNTYAPRSPSCLTTSR